MKFRWTKRCNRMLAFALSLTLMLSDYSLQYAMASGNDSVVEEVTMMTVSGSDAGQTSEPEAGEEQYEGTVSGSDSTFLPESTYVPEIPDVTGNITLREPEDFYEEPAPENFGTLAAYDAYSRTYHVDGDQYVTVIGNDGNTYIDEDGNLQQVDNTLVENPASTFSLWDTGTSYINEANDYTAMLTGSLTVSGGDVLTVASGDYALSTAPTGGCCFYTGGT